MTTQKIKPKEITRDSDNGLEMASFNYYEGMEYAKERNMTQTTSINSAMYGNHYMVICGDVVIFVSSDEFPDIQRRLI